MAKIRAVRVVKSKYGTYYLHYTNADGCRRRLSAGSEYSYAQKLQIRFNEFLLLGLDPEYEFQKEQQRNQTASMTVRQFFPIFLERHAKFRSASMVYSYQMSFKNILRCPQLADCKLSQVSKRLVLDFLTARMQQDGVKPATVNRAGAMLKVMFSKAVEWEYLEHSPLDRMRLFPENNRRDVDITVEQMQKLIRELPSPVDKIVEFAVYTGFRKENILSLRIEAIRFGEDGHTGEASLTIKGNRREVFPLGPQATDVVRAAIGKRKEGFVFINPKTGKRYACIHKSFDRAVARLGLTVNGTKFRFHDCRHLFGTWLHRAGISLDTIRPLMGHRDRATTDRYISIDRIGAGRVLSLLPNLRPMDETREENKKGDVVASPLKLARIGTQA